MEKVLVLDVGGTKISYGVVSQDRVMNFYVVKISEIGRDGLIDSIVSVIRDFQRTYAVEFVVIGVPAVVNAGTIVSAPNLPMITELNRISMEGVRVFIERDVNLLLLGEHSFGAASGYRHAVGIFVGTGLGMSVLIDGKIFKGAHGAAAELGHVHYPTGDVAMCGCGKENCLELFASGRALERISDSNKVPLEDIFVVSQGNQLVASFLEALSFGVSTVVNLFDPEVVVIGGGVVEAKGFPWDELKEKICEKIRPPLPRSKVVVKRAELGYSAALLGGYRYIQDFLNG